MISSVFRYFKIIRIFSLAVGLWPYQQSKLVQFQAILFSIILFSCITFQLTVFITADFSFGLLINVLSYVLCFTIIMFGYVSFATSIENIKCLLEQLQQMWNELKDEKEIAIIEKYGNYIKHSTIMIASLWMGIAMISITEPIFTLILRSFLSVNMSQPYYTTRIVTEYFVDQEKYFYIILLHIDVAIFIAMMQSAAMGTLLIGFTTCACGMFKIASYRIKQALTISLVKNLGMKNDVKIYKKIICAVGIHRKAIQFLEYLVSSFEAYLFFFLGSVVISMSIALFGATTCKNDIQKLLQYFIFVFAILILMFISNYIGQEITEHNNYIFLAIYNSKWYMAPLHIQKLTLFLLLKGSKDFHLNIAGIFVASLESFVTVATASISYFTVIYSMQH